MQTGGEYEQAKMLVKQILLQNGSIDIIKVNIY
jgi:hypothetical protein